MTMKAGSNTASRAATPAGTLVVLIATAVLCMAHAADPFQLATCSGSTAYFDTPSLSCKSCAVTGNTQRLADSGSIDALGSASSCTCAAGYVKAAATCDISVASTCGPYTCTSCLSSNQAASRDRSRCMPCGTNSTLSSTKGECVCIYSQSVLIESTITGTPLAAKQCVECPSDARVFLTDSGSFKADPYACQFCPDPNMQFNANNECECKSGYTLAGVAEVQSQVCLPSAQANALQLQFSSSTAATVTYNDVLTAVGGAVSSKTVSSSILFRNLYLKSAVRCFNWASAEDNEACQAIANLCALQHFSPSATVCDLAKRIIATRGGSVHGWTSWATTMPLLQLSVDADTVLKSLDLPGTMSFDAATQSGTNEWMSYVLARYNINGTFLGTQELTYQFQYCNSGGSSNSGKPRWLKYGVSVATTLDCDLRDLVAGGEQEMYDLYVVDWSRSTATEIGANGLPSYIYPVPVRNVNYKEGATTVNVNAEDGDEADDVLTHRFFLYDTASGVTKAGDTAEVIRFAKSITLTVTGQSTDPAITHPPVLTIEYGERLPSSFAATPELAATEIAFEVHYTTSISSFWTFALIMFVLCVIAAVLSCSLRLFIWQRRETRTMDERAITLSVIGRAIIYFAGSFSRFTFWLLVLISCYWFIFFKAQDAVFTLMPPDSSILGNSAYATFDLVLFLAFFGSLIRIVELVWNQTHVDLFFLDWENERNPPVVITSANGDTEAGMGGGAGVGAGYGQPSQRGKRVERFPQVSAWRTIMCANEWSEMQVQRKTSLVVTLLWLLFLLRGLQLEYLATPQPTMADLTAAPTNRVLLFACIAIGWLTACGAQLLWNWAIYYRYIAEPPTTRFIDLSSMAKVSAFIMPNKYHGFYLHCRSPHPHADCNIIDIIEPLQRESKKLSVGRGLDDCEDKMVQAYEVFFTKNWRMYYDRVHEELRSDLSRIAHEDAFQEQRLFLLQFVDMICGTTKRHTKEATTKILAAQLRLAKFMKSFVDKSNTKHPRDYEDQSNLISFLRVPPDFVSGPTASTSINLFYCDYRSHWTEVVFWGAELDLMIFNLLTFAVVTRLSSNTVWGACCTYFVQWLLTAWRIRAGQTNIANKTMVDDRFLQ